MCLAFSWSQAPAIPASLSLPLVALAVPPKTALSLAWLLFLILFLGLALFSAPGPLHMPFPLPRRPLVLPHLDPRVQICKHEDPSPLTGEGGRLCPVPYSLVLPLDIRITLLPAPEPALPGELRGPGPRRMRSLRGPGGTRLPSTAHTSPPWYRHISASSWQQKS